MPTNQRLIKLATADAATLARIDAILDHRDLNERVRENVDNRLVTISDAAKQTHLSRPTIYRLIASGKLRTVELNGVRRVVLSSITEFVNGKVA